MVQLKEMWNKLNTISDYPKQTHHFIWIYTIKGNILLVRYHLNKGFQFLDKWDYIKDIEITHWCEFIRPNPPSI